MTGPEDSGPIERSVQGAVDWLDSRTSLSGSLESSVYKRVPLHRYSVFYLAGGACLFVFGMQALTGLLMLLYFQATPEVAHDSLRRIMSIPYGWLVRSLHSWGADVFLVFLLGHFSTAYLMRAYRSPRQLTWMTGFTVLVLALVFHSTGASLAWNDPVRAGDRTRVERPGPPAAGPAARVAADPGLADQLTRAYLIHVLVLPVAVILLVGLHLALVQRHGMSTPADVRPVRDIPFFPVVALIDQAVWMALFAGLLAAASLRPATLASRTENILFGSLQMLRRWAVSACGPWGAWVVDGALAALAVAWVTLPFWDRGAERRRRTRAARVIGLATAALIVAAIAAGARN